MQGDGIDRLNEDGEVNTATGYCYEGVFFHNTITIVHLNAVNGFGGGHCRCSRDLSESRREETVAVRTNSDFPPPLR